MKNPKCQVTRCNNPHQNFKHYMTGELYCSICALKINRANPEYPNLIKPETPDFYEKKFTEDLRQLLRENSNIDLDEVDALLDEIGGLQLTSNEVIKIAKHVHKKT